MKTLCPIHGNVWDHDLVDIPGRMNSQIRYTNHRKALQFEFLNR